MARNPFGGGFVDNMQAGADYVNEFTDRFRSQRAGYRAAPKIAAGDYRGAASEYAKVGMPDQTARLTGEAKQRDAVAADQEKQGRAEVAKLWLGMAQNLSKLPDPQTRYQAFLQSPLAKMTLRPKDLSQVTPDDFTDKGLSLVAQLVKRELQIVNRGDGGYDVVDTGTGEAVRSVEPQRKPLALDPDKTYVLPADAPMATANPDVDRVFEALIAQESGGRAGVLGPETPYGRAEGKTQMLPATAEAMARKVGVPWNAALMRDNTPRGAAYQERLGRAYFEEGLQKYGGDVRKALMYYHGGPNEQLWGPKTRAYADQVLARAGGQDAQAGGTGGDELPGYRVLQRAQPERWEDLPGGGQRNTRTGETKNVPRTNGRLSASALNQQNEHLGALQAASAINTRLQRVASLLDSGTLDLGIAKNVFARGMNAVGMSNEATRAYASLRADLEKMRNDSLRLNKGVQTEGDAQRAWNELITNLNDPKLVRQRLEEIDAYNRQAIAFHKDMVNQIRSDSGMAPIDVSKFEAQPPAIRPTPDQRRKAAPAARSSGGTVIQYDAQGRRVK
jgi:hypothetical protein